jgi:hypothetical protein
MRGFARKAYTTAPHRSRLRRPSAPNSRAMGGPRSSVQIEQCGGAPQMSPTQIRGIDEAQQCGSTRVMIGRLKNIAIAVQVQHHHHTNSSRKVSYTL